MIEFRDVVKRYGENIPAIKHLTMTVGDGEFCVLLGASGCGKSTTLNMVNRLLEPDSGEILINGKNVKDYQPEQLRRSIGYVVQSISLFPNMTVAKNIAVVPNLLKWDADRTAQRVRELIATVGLDPETYLGKYPSQLSGGEAQRVGVARALAADPAILLMDEPFGAVDPLNRTKLQNEFLMLQRKLRKTVIFVTHDINEAMKMGDKIALMHDGELISYAAPRELLAENNEFVRRFMGSESFIDMLTRRTAAECARPRTSAGDIPTVSAMATLKDVLAVMIEHSCTEAAVEGTDASVSVDAITGIMKGEV